MISYYRGHNTWNSRDNYFGSQVIQTWNHLKVLEAEEMQHAGPASGSLAKPWKHV